MIAQALLNLVPQVLRHDRTALTFVDLAFMGDSTHIDRVRQDLVDVPPTEQSAGGRAASAIDADRNPKVCIVKLLLEAHHASRLEIAAK